MKITFPDGYAVSKVEDFDWHGSDDLTWIGDAQSIADPDWAISHLVDVQDSMEQQHWDGAWHACLMLLSSLALLAKKAEGPLVILTTVASDAPDSSSS